MRETRHIEGLITVVQESRFRLEGRDGRGYLFVLHAGQDERNLREFHKHRTPVTVTYTGRPDAGAVAETVRPAPARYRR